MTAAPTPSMNRSRGRRVVWQVLRSMLTVCVAVSLASCAMLGFKGEKASWDEVTLAASDDVNNNSPVAVDVVLVTDDAMLQRVAELPASKWFAGRADLASTFPKSIRYRSWEVVPGQRLEVSGDTFDGPRVAAAFVFANYPGPGAHRVRIEQFSGRMVVQLDNTAFSVSAAK